jgi:hypothetical protein
LASVMRTFCSGVGNSSRLVPISSTFKPEPVEDVREDLTAFLMPLHYCSTAMQLKSGCARGLPGRMLLLS